MDHETIKEIVICLTCALALCAVGTAIFVTIGNRRSRSEARNQLAVAVQAYTAMLKEQNEDHGAGNVPHSHGHVYPAKWDHDGEECDLCVAWMRVVELSKDS